MLGLPFPLGGCVLHFHVQVDSWLTPFLSCLQVGRIYLTFSYRLAQIVHPASCP